MILAIRLQRIDKALHALRLPLASAEDQELDAARVLLNLLDERLETLRALVVEEDDLAISVAEAVFDDVDGKPAEGSQSQWACLLDVGRTREIYARIRAHRDPTQELDGPKGEDELGIVAADDADTVSWKESHLAPHLASS